MATGYRIVIYYPIVKLSFDFFERSAVDAAILLVCLGPDYVGRNVPPSETFACEILVMAVAVAGFRPGHTDIYWNLYKDSIDFLVSRVAEFMYPTAC